MKSPADLVAKLQPLIAQLKLQTTLLETPGSIDDLRWASIFVGRLADQMLHHVQASTLDELRSSRPMPEHGFKGSQREPFTLDDL